MKYIIDVPSDLYIVYGTLRVPVKVGNGDLSWYNTYIKAEPYTEPDRKAIEDEVAEFWKTVKDMDADSLDKIFGEMNFWAILNSMPYQKAKVKYDAWKKQKEEIRVGDEVKDKDLEDKGIVTSVLATRCDVLWIDGTVSEDVLMSELCKTDRHFDEVEELLKKIKEK